MTLAHGSVQRCHGKNIEGFAKSPFVINYVCNHVATSFFVLLCCEDEDARDGSQVDSSLTVWYCLCGCTVAMMFLVTAVTFS